MVAAVHAKELPARDAPQGGQGPCRRETS
jgi:hypothetical protein